MSERRRWPAIPRPRSEAGVFILATVAVLILVATLALMSAYHWAVADWQMVSTSLAKMTAIGWVEPDSPRI
jgi:hypothetical protein